MELTFSPEDEEDSSSRYEEEYDLGYITEDGEIVALSADCIDNGDGSYTCAGDGPGFGSYVVYSYTPDEVVSGCTESNACNFNEIATLNDGTCYHAEEYYNCDESCILDSDSDGVCDELEVLGCMDDLACNYDPEATNDDGDCEGACLVSIDCTGECGGNVDTLDCIPSITELIDQPNDQGFSAILTFNGSAAESQDSNNEFYLIQRFDSIDIVDNSGIGVEPEWVIIDTVFAQGQNVYVDTVATLQNSNLSSFKVVASMDVGEYYSNVGEVFSIDNILPTRPFNLSIVETFPETNGVHISWEIDTLLTPDLSHYKFTRIAFYDESITIVNDNIYEHPEEILDNFYIDIGLSEDMYRYWYIIFAYDINGNRSSLDMTDYLDFIVYDGSLSNDIIDIPDSFELHGCYPNPFNPTTSISFSVPEFSKVSLDVYSIDGRYLETISNKYHAPGIYSLDWNARILPSGIYLIKMESEKFAKVQKVTLLK